MHHFKEFIASSIASLLTVAQFVLIFFFSIDGIHWLRVTGYVIWGIAAIFGWLPIFAFKRLGGVKRGESYVHTTKVVKSGLYSVIRHPQYLAFPLLNIAMILVSQHWLIILLGVPSILLMAVDIRRADEGLVEKFGNEYGEYMNEVPAFNLPLGIYKLIRKKMARSS